MKSEKFEEARPQIGENVSRAFFDIIFLCSETNQKEEQRSPKGLSFIVEEEEEEKSR